jgi:hypothetical protein
MDKMNLFQNLPIELETIIWEYIGPFKLRNGKPMYPITHYPPIIVNHFPILETINNHSQYNCILHYGVPSLTLTKLRFKLNRSYKINMFNFVIQKCVFEDKIDYWITCFTTIHPIADIDNNTKGTFSMSKYTQK